MSTRRSRPPASLVLLLTCPFVHLACYLDPSPLGQLPGTGGGDGGSTFQTSGPGEPTTDRPDPTTGQPGLTTGLIPDSTGGPTTGDPTIPEPRCAAHDACDQLDVLFVIDNSGTMGEEQNQLAASFPAFVALLRDLRDSHGRRVGADVHLMVTTTDVPHPLCTPFEKPDYDAADGQPIDTPCTERLARFTGRGADPPSMPDICTSRCSQSAPAAPSDPFIQFSPTAHNILDPDGLGDPAADALACIGPQGIDGCGMEAPLEAMLRALDPEARWNSGERPFLRRGAPLAIILVTDETDCSTFDYAHFDPKLVDDPEFNQYWPLDPDSGAKKEPTSAVCWNAGMTCLDSDEDGVYESCMSEDRGVLHPVARYTDALDKRLRIEAGKDVLMLVLGGVPPVTAHNSDPPFQPTAGGVFDLVHRPWSPADILPGDAATPAQKQYEFGIGPGCVGPAGQAVPPGRIQEVCQALDIPGGPDAPRCCIESVCDDDYTPALTCLTGMLRPVLRGQQ